jgi:MFS family permease
VPFPAAVSPRPAQPASLPRFYTPRVVATSAIILALTAPGQTAAISAFIDPLITGLHISRTLISTAYMIGTLTGAAAMPLAGRCIDRFGARRMAALIGLAFGGVLVALPAVRGIAGLTAGFAGLRMFGQGALNLTATTAVAIYIERRRGLAMGITAAVGAAGISLAPVALESLVAAHGFRSIWFIEGLVIWALVIPLALVGLPRGPVTSRRPREPAGPADAADPDGATEAEAGPEPIPGPEPVSVPEEPPPVVPAAGRHHRELPPVAWTRAQAMGTSMFWVIATGIAVVSLLGTALSFNQISLLGERGLTPAQAAANFIPQTIAGLAATLVTGYLADRFSDRTLIIASLSILTLALASAGFVAPGWSAIGYGVAMGVAGNSFRVLEATAFPSCFGLTHIGAIRGVVHTLTVVGSALGPVLLALGHQWVGSYRPVVLVLTVMPLAAIAFAAFAKNPPRYPPGYPPGARTSRQAAEEARRRP